jgi:hypothetical protein
MSQWYVCLDGKQKLGPFTPQQLLALARAGQLKPAHMVLKEGQVRWVKAAVVKGLWPPTDILDGRLICKPVPDEQPQSRPVVPSKPPQEDVREVMDCEGLELDTACPFCCETIKPDAKKCKHCGEFLDPKLRAAQGGESRNVAAASATVVVQQNRGPRPVRLVRVHSFAVWTPFHIIMTILTFGLWTPIWLIHYLIWYSSVRSQIAAMGEYDDDD